MEELDPITIAVGSNFTEDPPREDGYTTYVDGTVDTSAIGVYIVTYTLIRLQPTFGTKTYTRKVTVTEAPSNTGTITLNGDSVVSVPLADANDYVDEGATSTDGTVFVTNLDGTSSETFTGLPSTAGSYTLVYFLSGSISNFVTRTIHIIGNSVAPSDPAPTSGPTNLDTDIIPPDAVPTSGPTNLDTTHKPAKGFPLTSIDTDEPINKPSKGYPITSIETDTVETATKPATGYPVESISFI